MAASVLMATHDQPTMAANIITELGLRNADCSELDEFDKESLRKVQEQSGSRLKLRGLRSNHGDVLPKGAQRIKFRTSELL